MAAPRRLPDPVQAARGAGGSSLTRRLLFVAAACIAAGLLLVVAVHVSTGLDPVSHRLSEYVHEPTGGLMVGAFVVFGAGLVALGVAIGTYSSPRSTLVASLIGAAGLGMILSGMFPTDVGSDTAGGMIHSRASGGATLALLAAAIVWSRGDRTLTWIAAGAPPLAVVSVVLHDTRWSGVGQRLLWAALTAWLLLAAGRVERHAAGL